MNIPASIEKLFKERFKVQPLIVRSPGRVNLIGEHTDYNEGFVLPAAIDKATYVAVSAREDNQCEWFAADLNESFTCDITNLQKQKGWANYLMGVAAQIQKAGYKIKGFNCVFGGDIPIGAGLSSSAALECALAFALNELFNLGIDKLTLVKMAQKAEHEYAGVMCGIMDQFASTFGKEGHAIKLDCRSLDFEYFPIKMEGIRIVLCDTQVKHSLASSAYNKRREQCEEGVRIIHKHHPEVKSLRDVTIEMVSQHLQVEHPEIYQRCAYVVEENNRLLAGCEDLQRGDLASFGNRMYLSHYGLRDMYEVSCKELDFLVAFAEKEKAVIGARMMGGGFGGCTINLVKEDGLQDFSERISKAYKEAMGQELKIYTAIIKNGTSLVK